MTLPRSGRVLIIDDHLNEAKPLIEILSKKGIPVSYFSGEKDQFPDQPLLGVRVVFLDVVLGTTGQSDKTKIGTAVNVINKLIDKNNGPFLIAAWTKHPECIQKIGEKLKHQHVFIIDLKKSDCQDEGSGGEMVYKIEKIEHNIKEQMKEIGIFHIYSIWENFVHDASTKSVNNFSSFCIDKTNWNKEMCSIFYSLALANAGRQVDETDKINVIKNAFYTFNSAFLDSLENQFNNIEHLLKIDELSISFSDKHVKDQNTRASINSMLLLSMTDISKRIEPGSVCGLKRRNFKMLRALIDQDIADERIISKLNKSYIPILLEVSPSCDYSQNKWKLHRQLPGILWPTDCMRTKVKGKNKEIVKNAEYIYQSPIFIYNKKIYRMVFDLREFSTSSFNIDRKNAEKKSFHSLGLPIFRIRHDLLIDIQSKISQHVSRPGFVSL